ncbi:MAG TPA: hypothetical protein VFO76_10950, partial [Candidatus Kapabacteria bacterium]|nr:hypothetical protein [Candidatus Kapabacteria bacterium]
MQAERHILLLLDGDEPPRELLLEHCGNARFIIATDGAARIAKMHDIHLDVIIGDMDSIDEMTKAFYENQDTAIITIPEQYS